MRTAQLTDLIAALEFSSEEHATYFDRETGKVVSVDRFLLSSLEDRDKQNLADLPDWQREELEMARAIVADEAGRFIDPPDKFEFHEYRQMERFVQSLPDAAADQLWRTLKGRGAFRHFKDTAHRLGLLEKWYRYRDDAAREFVLEWAKDNDVSVEDDTPRRGTQS